ncbi:MAG: RNA polymerase sigma factor RpoH [Gammaproteobacteria bacterium]|nr:RNA polymerase sigma factor RpoH [Gammaproteobacteria bacterium]MCD8542387.1 RNA polymerase sigma factor RpoH [Gammaproteobacteria bacterium]
MNSTGALRIYSPLLPASGLDSYISYANSIPLLSLTEEQDYAKKLFFEGDLSAAKNLILPHLRYVIKIARSYSGYGLGLSDLIQEGNIGLMKAVKRFNPDIGVRLVSFAVHWIKAEIHEFIIKNWRIVKIATTKAQRKLFFNLRKMKSRLGWLSKQEIEDVANDLGVQPSEVMQMESRLNAMDASFDAPSDESEPSFVPAQYLEDKNTNPEIALEQNDFSERQQELLHQALENLDSRSRLVLQARWLTDTKATLHELAAELGVSAERIRQIEAAAFKKIKSAILPQTA